MIQNADITLGLMAGALNRLSNQVLNCNVPGVDLRAVSLRAVRDTKRLTAFIHDWIVDGKRPQ